MISDLEIKLGDFMLSDYFDLTAEPDRGLFPEVQHNLVTMARANGVRATSRRLGHRIITLPLYALSGNFRETKDALAPALMADGRQALWFSDEPDRYWMVELTGESSLSRSLDQKSVAEGQLQFLCEDGLAHALKPESFPFNVTTDGIIATVQNTGTYKAPVDINAKFLSDADSIGFVSEENLLQFGTPYSEEAENFVASTKIMNDPMGTTTKQYWQENVANIRWRMNDGETSSKIMGSMKYEAEDTRPASYGTPPADKPGFWHGPSTSHTLTNPIDNFKAFHRLYFKATGTSAQKKASQGLIEINYVDADGNFVMALVMRHNGEKVWYSFIVGTERIYEVALSKSAYTTETGFFGTIEFSKVGNKFTFRLASAPHTSSGFKENWVNTKTFTNDSVAMLSPYKVNCFMAQWNKVRAMDIRLTHSRITKINTEEEALVPMEFYAGDELYVDGSNNHVYINGIRNDDYRIIGSDQMFRVEPGDTEIAVVSDGTVEGELSIRRQYV